MFRYSRQPWKSLYVAYVVVLVAFRLPVWTVLALIPATRPRRSWPVSRTLRVWLIDIIVKTWFRVGFPRQPVVEGTPEDTGCVWVEPISDEFVVGEIKLMAEKNQVKPERICGYWHGQKGADGMVGQRAGPGERVLYYFHGGGYTVGISLL